MDCECCGRRVDHTAEVGGFWMCAGCAVVATRFEMSAEIERLKTEIERLKAELAKHEAAITQRQGWARQILSQTGTTPPRPPIITDDPY